MPASSRRKSRRRSESRSEETTSAAVNQLPRARLVNRFPPLEPLSADQLEAVHDASMRILEEQGVEVMSAKARQLFGQAGADVDDATEIVRGDRNLFLEAVAKAPASFTLTPRNPENAIEVGGNVLNFGMVSGPPNVHDRINGRRPGNFADYKKLISLAQYFNVIKVLGNQTLAPIDIPANTRHLDTYRENILLTDKIWSGIPIGIGRVKDAVNMVAIGKGVSVEDMRHAPGMIANININSPRKLDDTMADAAMYLAELGQPVICTPFTLMGAMTPVTMAGALAQQNAEAILAIAMLQLASPGAPAIYGGFTSNVDMRSGAPAFGTPENALANIIGGQLARRYSLPYRTSACSASNDTDAQAVYESSNALWGAVLGYGNVIYHAAGWMEGGLVASFEKFIIDVESLQAMTCMLQPVTINEEEFGLDAMREVGPGGHFFGVGHTMDRYKTAFYEPILSDWQNNQAWELAGAKSAAQRATEVWQKVLAEFEPPELAPDRREALDEYVARRKQEIGSDEP